MYTRRMPPLLAIIFAAGGTLLMPDPSIAAAPDWFHRTTHPDAQWFPEAGFGLFIHWGIHSVPGIQPSWAMIKDYPAGADPRYHPPEKYYALADEFDPDKYDPDLWMAAAKKAGFTYAVLTTKHHDGYCLWPTAHGEMNTGKYLGGRDLLRPYVEACRRHGLKVGLYFSPRDWSYPGYPLGDVDFDYNKRGKYRSIEPEKNRRDFEAFYAYTIGQMGELLTRYGKIDVLWFDGMGWHGIDDIRTRQTIEWVRGLQPWIVMNNRWGDVGDYGTPEWHGPEERPGGWWEHCISWNGHWGYNPGKPFQSSAWVLDTLAKNRAWGGNFLLNCGPAPDGTMPDGFYERCEELAAWMAHSRDAVIGASPGPWPQGSNVPVTTRGATWYLHLLSDHTGAATLSGVPQPCKVVLMRTGEAVHSDWVGEVLTVSVPHALRTEMDDVVTVEWETPPEVAIPE